MTRHLQKINKFKKNVKKKKTPYFYDLRKDEINQSAV